VRNPPSQPNDEQLLRVAIATTTTPEGRVTWRLLLESPTLEPRRLAEGTQATLYGALFDASMTLASLWGGLWSAQRSTSASKDLLTAEDRAMLDSITSGELLTMPEGLLGRLIGLGETGIRNASMFNWFLGLAKKMNTVSPTPHDPKG
jgi:hypothetical protein